MMRRYGRRGFSLETSFDISPRDVSEEGPRSGLEGIQARMKSCGE